MNNIEIAERIVIDYANLSGRESANRAEFRIRVRKHLAQQEERMIEMLDDMPDITESDGWEGIKEQSCCPGDDFADGYNKCKRDIINKIKEDE